MQFRMKSEYGVDTQIEILPYRLARWLEGPPRELDAFRPPTGCLLCEDGLGRRVVLFGHEWDLDYCRKANPAVALREAESLGAEAMASQGA
jgi:peptide chain release factor 3